MPSLKSLKRRISSVKSTQQIMNAMDLVAASKLQKAREQREAVSELFREMKRIVDGVKGADDTAENIFLAARGEIKNVAYIVIASDRGLCGGYNLNVSRAALEKIEARKVPEKIIAVGNRSYEYFRRRGKNIVSGPLHAAESAYAGTAAQIAGTVSKMYISGEVDEVYVVYTEFISMLSHEPRAERILPLEGAAVADGYGYGGFMAYEPDINTFLEYAVPTYLNVFLQGAIAESVVCEHAARMMSMDSASKNAEEIIDDLTLMYNRERQSIITQELNEIVSGANALE